MDRPWFSQYPAGMPREIDSSQYASVVALYEEAFAKYAERDAYHSLGKRMSYGQMDRWSAQLGAYLQGLGLQQGDRVALMMPNLFQFPVAAAAILRAGFVIVNVNPLYTPRELEYQLNDSGAKAIIILENFAHTLEKVIARSTIKHVIVSAMGDLLGGLKGHIVNFVVRKVKKLVPAYELPGHVRFKTALSDGARRTLNKPKLTHESIAVLQYTGGTTGVAKGAILLHKTIVANLLSSEAWLSPALSLKKRSGPPIFVCALPLYHVFAFVTCGLLGLRTGGMSVLIPNAKDIPATVKELAKHRFHVFPAVNTLFNALLNHPDFAKIDFSELCLANGGGMAVQEAVAKRWLAATGCPIVEGYGLSETCSGAICNITTSNTFTGTIGLPMASIDACIVDEEGRPLPSGEVGEIAIKAESVSPGYWQQEEETKKAFTADGYFKTGDMGVMDERGYFKIVDRKKDMILVSGFNVYPNEVEAVAVSHPGVLEAAAIGMPDECAGEVVKLFVVKKDPALTEEALKKFCAEQLTGYKRPKKIEFRTELPKTNVGKILRRALRDEVPSQTS